MNNPAIKNKMKRRISHNLELLMLCLPAVIIVFIFSYIPMLGIIIAFKDYNYTKGILGSNWAGFENFKFFFLSQFALRVTRNTVFLNACFIIIGLVVSILFALMLFELSRKLTRVYQTALFFPFFLSWVVVGYITYVFLNFKLGVVNNILSALGLDRINWYSEPRYWVAILIIVFLWKTTGYSSIIYYAGLMGIDQSYYEAADIDGASKFQKIKNISIPLLSPLITIITIFNIGRIFYSDFGMFFFLPRDSGMLYSVTDVIDTYVYRSLRVTGEIGMASAVGLYQSVVGFILVIVTNFIVRRINSDNALF